MKVIAVPGPVSYPLLAATREFKDIQIEFGKEGEADAVLDSSVSLIRRGLPIHYTLIRGLVILHPDLTDKISVWRRGSAGDVLLRSYLSLSQRKAEIVYVENMGDTMKLLREGKVSSALVSPAVGSGRDLEALLETVGVKSPGSCGAYVKGNVDELREAYLTGLRMFREDPEGTSEFVADSLPTSSPSTFVAGNVLKTHVTFERTGDYSRFQEVVKSFT